MSAPVTGYDNNWEFPAFIAFRFPIYRPENTAYPMQKASVLIFIIRLTRENCIYR